MISKQQATRHIDGEPMLDVLLGGGRTFFEEWGFFQNESVWRGEYGWSTVTDNATAFLEDLQHVDTSQMPFMGLFGINISQLHLHSHPFFACHRPIIAQPIVTIRFIWIA